GVERGPSAASNGVRGRCVGPRGRTAGRRFLVDHHDGLRVRGGESELARLRFNGIERSAAVELRLERFLNGFSVLQPVLQASGFAAETDHLEVLPREEKEEQTDRDAER